MCVCIYIHTYIYKKYKQTKLHRNWKERAISKQRRGRQNRLTSLLSSLPSLPPPPPCHPFSHSNLLSPLHSGTLPASSHSLATLPFHYSLSTPSPSLSLPATPHPRALPWPASGAKEREKRVPSELLWVLIPPRGRGSSAASRCSPAPQSGATHCPWLRPDYDNPFQPSSRLPLAPTYNSRKERVWSGGAR